MNEIERAIEYLAPITEHPTITGEYCKNLKVALAALREKAERERGCEYCGSGRKQLISLMCHGGRKPKYYNPIPRHSFCPMCGKKLEVEP